MKRLVVGIGGEDVGVTEVMERREEVKVMLSKFQLSGYVVLARE